MSEPAPVYGAVWPLLPPFVLAVCIACVAGAGALANCALLAALLKSSRNGLFYILIQLAIADLILLGTITPELWSHNTRTWSFGRSGCIAFRGLNVFTSTASLYLIFTIALHSLATMSEEDKKALQLSSKRDDHDDDDDEIRSSRHSLVASDTSTPRTMNVDYRLTNTRIRIAPPVAFVWILSASLSIPEFVLSTTVHLDHDVVLCTLVDTTHRLNMHSLLAIFNLFLPVVIMCVTGILILGRYKRRTQSNANETYSALKLSLYLIYLYAALCVPRSIVTVYSLYSTSTVDNEYAVEQPGYVLALINLVCSCIYLAAALIRPLLCIIVIPRLRKVFFFGLRNSTEDN
ncbi:uncharacterized protein [Battus philenor]|uniref:uncharacterized protein n=1 Tax=Battus philenor TaxID=42288 RepID=UPI0035D0AEA1